MGREQSMKPAYEILAYITDKDNNVISGNCLILKTNNEDEKKALTVDIAKALKADVTKLSNGDYIVVRV